MTIHFQTLPPFQTLPTLDGTDIHYYCQIPSCPKAIVVISHGYGGHAGQYIYFTEFLNHEGYGVYAFDHRGHGHSLAPKGHIESYEYFINDLEYLILFIKSAHPDIPIYMFGHSMGGFIAFVYGLLHPETLRGQIFSAPALGAPWGTHLIPSWFWHLGGKYFSKLRIYPLVKRKSCRDPMFEKSLRQDPFALKYATLGFFNQFIYRGINWAAANSASYELPCLILHGKQDRIIPYQSSVRIYSQITAQEKTLKLYEELYHELVQEPERETVMQDIIAWLDHQNN